MNELILESLDPRAWRAQPPGRKVRTIAAIFAHMHNVRSKWIRLSAPHIPLPAKLDRTRSTQSEAGGALAESARRCLEMIQEALDPEVGRIKEFLRDGWATPWPAGAAMVAYMVAHDSHHRGQVSMLAHQLGFPLPAKVGSSVWRWETLWKDCGFTRPH